MEYQSTNCFCCVYCLPPAERTSNRICSLDACKYKEMAEKAYKEMSLEEANQLPAAILKQRWIEVHNATVNLYYLKNGRDIVMVEPSELECKIAGWRKALKYIGNHGHNARTSPAEKLREMIEDEIKRLTRPQVVQLELFSF